MLAHLTRILLGEIALSLLDRLNEKETVAKTLLEVYAFIDHWYRDMRVGIKPLLYGFQVGMEAGEVEIAFWSLVFHDFALYLTASCRLDVLAKEMSDHVRLLRRFKQEASVAFLECMLQLVLKLKGEAADPLICCACENEKPNAVLQMTVLSSKLQIAFLFRDLKSAEMLAEQTVLYGTKNSPGHQGVPRNFLFRGLTALALARGGRRRRKNIKKGTHIISTMEKWMRDGNINCTHMVQLLKAELASLQNRKAEAGELYKAAIQTANRLGYLQDKALAHELAGAFHLKSDPDSYWAVFHFENAILCFDDWKASAKVMQLIEKYGKMIESSEFSSTFNLKDRLRLSPSNGEDFN